MAKSPHDLDAPQPDDRDGETRMRRALGLGTGTAPRRTPAAGGRHRFVRDGEVPVVVVNGNEQPGSPPGANRVASLNAALEAERAEKVAIQRSLADAQATIQQLRTKLAHAEMAASEALAHERSQREAAEFRAQDAAELRRAEAEAPILERKTRSPRVTRPVVEEPEAEEEPVKWWLPDYRNKGK